MYLRLTTLLMLMLSFSLLWAEGRVAIPPLEDRVQEIQLDNGLKVVVVERETAPVFFALMNFRVGSTIEDVGKSGLSHFMEHMLFKGTETLGTMDYVKEKPIMDELEKIATRMRDRQIGIEPWRFDKFEALALETKASLPAESSEQDGGSNWNAVLAALPAGHEGLPADWQKTSWIYTDNGRDYWAEYRSLLADRQRTAELIKEQRQYIQQSALDAVYSQHGGQMLNAFTSYDETGYMVGLPANCLELWMYLESDRFQHPVFREFYSEREVVQEELLGNENEPFERLMKNLIQTAFTAHPYGRPIIGWQEDIKLTLRSEMDQHFHRYYAPNNCQMTIVGNVSAEQVFYFARKYFGSWKPGEAARQVTVVEPEQQGERRVSVEFEAEPRMMIGYHVPAAPEPDFYPLSIVESILSEGRTSRFYKSVFQEQQLTAGPPGAFMGPGDKYPGLFIIVAGPNALHTVDEVEQALLTELEKMKTEPVTAEEIIRVHNRYQTYQLARLKSNQWLAFSLAEGFVNQGDWRSVISDYERLMAVTPADIQRVANKYFTAKNRVVAILTKPSEAAAETVINRKGAEQCDR